MCAFLNVVCSYYTGPFKFGQVLNSDTFIYASRYYFSNLYNCLPMLLTLQINSVAVELLLCFLDVNYVKNE